MNLLPYKSVTIETQKSFESIRSKLDKICILTDKNFGVQSILNNVIEYKVTGHNFQVVMGGYGFFHGSSNLNPELRGKFTANEQSKNKIRFTISPQRNGLILLLLLYAFAILGLIISIQRNQLEGIITTAVFIVVTYWWSQVRFNKILKKYMDLIGKLKT